MIDKEICSEKILKVTDGYTKLIIYCMYRMFLYILWYILHHMQYASVWCLNVNRPNICITLNILHN